jgi:hypothetical protein
MKVGDSVQVTRTFSSQDLRDYARLCGHKAAVEHDRIPGPLIGALFSYLLGVKLPGMGTMYLKQQTSFKPGAVIGEALTARVEITRLRPDKQLADLSTTCQLANGEIITSGRALVYIGDLQAQGGEDG